MPTSKTNLRDVSSDKPDILEPVNPNHVFRLGRKIGNITRIEGFDNQDVTFPVPYKVEPRETYGMRFVKGKWQLWEVAHVPQQPGTYVWVREAPRVR